MLDRLIKNKALKHTGIGAGIGLGVGLLNGYLGTQGLRRQYTKELMKKGIAREVAEKLSRDKVKYGKIMAINGGVGAAAGALGGFVHHVSDKKLIKAASELQDSMKDFKEFNNHVDKTFEFQKNLK